MNYLIKKYIINEIKNIYANLKDDYVAFSSEIIALRVTDDILVFVYYIENVCVEVEIVLRQTL